jgi:hypothetical protein
VLSKNKKIKQEKKKKQLKKTYLQIRAFCANSQFDLAQQQQHLALIVLQVFFLNKTKHTSQRNDFTANLRARLEGVLAEAICCCRQQHFARFQSVDPANRWSDQTRASAFETCESLASRAVPWSKNKPAQNKNVWFLLTSKKRNALCFFDLPPKLWCRVERN